DRYCPSSSRSGPTRGCAPGYSSASGRSPPRRFGRTRHRCFPSPSSCRPRLRDARKRPSSFAPGRPKYYTVIFLAHIRIRIRLGTPITVHRTTPRFARSGTRAFHVDSWGWAVRDFGSAYGYAMYATRKAPITELRVSILYDRLEDVVTSPWDAYAAGVSLDLLDASYHSLGRLRYITSYRASSNAGRCAPTTSDVVLPAPSALGVWTDLGRNPTADFPAAPWPSAEYVKVSIGFLCAAGLTGAR